MSSDIVAHLYRAWLRSETTDVSLKLVLASQRPQDLSFSAIYRCHRVVLIQSDFFRSLFTSGFAEARHRRHADLDEAITVKFDDPNISRAAFEICLARLYGGGPKLTIPSHIVPTKTHPLTPCSAIRPADEGEPHPGHQVANAPFLLSILATSLYLSMPTLAYQALSFILNTISPQTALLYLNFALGQGVSESLGTEPAVGLGNLATPLDDISTAASQGLKLSTTDRNSPSPSETTVENDEADPPRKSYYGTISDKIGEAATSWLARWGPDLLLHELEVADNQARCRRFPVLWNRGGLSAEWINTLLSSDALFVRSERERYNLARSVVELRRSSGIIPEEEHVWAGVFESAIYYANMSPEDMIHVAQDISSTTKLPFVSERVLQTALWNHTILRTHITPRTPSSPPSPPGSPLLREKDLGITMTTSQLLSHIRSLSHDNPAATEQERNKLYFRIPSDTSVRLGENGQNGKVQSIMTMDELCTFNNSPSDSPPSAETKGKGESTHVHTEQQFFGLARACYPAKTCIELDASGRWQWSPHQPFRFGVEFWGVGELREKQKVYSQTVWYGGSLFNIYVQMVRKKNHPNQLGIYVHRQSTLEAIPTPSRPLSTRPSLQEHSRSASLNPSPSPPPIHYSPSIHPLRPQTPTARQYTSSSLPSPSPLHPASPVATSMAQSRVMTSSPPVGPTPEQQPYRDPRGSISAYFMVCCFSSKGNSQTRFASSPDVFKISHSWGWRSGALLNADEADFITTPDTASGHHDHDAEVSLRATVVMGLV